MLEEKLRLIPNKIQAFLEHVDWSPGDFADALDIRMEEGYKLLSGEPVNYYAARKFIHYFQASLAKEFIDWEAMDVKPPRLKSSRQTLKDDVLFSIVARNIRDREKEKKLR